MPNRTYSFVVRIEPLIDWDGVWSGEVKDLEGPQGPGAKMQILSNSLEMVGRIIDDFITDRKLNAHTHTRRK